MPPKKRRLSDGNDPNPKKKSRISKQEDDDDDEDDGRDEAMAVDEEYFEQFLETCQDKSVLFPPFVGEKNPQAKSSNGKYISVDTIALRICAPKWSLNVKTRDDFLGSESDHWKLFGGIFSQPMQQPYSNEIGSIASPLVAVLRTIATKTRAQVIQECPTIIPHDDYFAEGPQSMAEKRRSLSSSKKRGAPATIDAVYRVNGRAVIFELKNSSLMKDVLEALKTAWKNQDAACEEETDDEREFTVPLSSFGTTVDVRRAIREAVTNCVSQGSSRGCLQCRNLGIALSVSAKQDPLRVEVFVLPYEFLCKPESRSNDFRLLMTLIERRGSRNQMRRLIAARERLLKRMVKGDKNFVDPDERTSATSADTSQDASQNTSQTSAVQATTTNLELGDGLRLFDYVCHGDGYGAYRFQTSRAVGFCKAVPGNCTGDVPNLIREGSVLRTLANDAVFRGHVPSVLGEGYFDWTGTRYYGLFLEDVGPEPEEDQVDWEVVSRLKQRCEELDIPHDFDVGSTINLCSKKNTIYVIDFVR